MKGHLGVAFRMGMFTPNGAPKDARTAIVEGLGVPSFKHFVGLGAKNTPSLAVQRPMKSQTVVLSSGRTAKMTL